MHFKLVLTEPTLGTRIIHSNFLSGSKISLTKASISIPIRNIENLPTLLNDTMTRFKVLSEENTMDSSFYAYEEDFHDHKK